jgi:hypothetical protein
MEQNEVGLEWDRQLGFPGDLVDHVAWPGFTTFVAHGPGVPAADIIDRIALVDQLVA